VLGLIHTLICEDCAVLIYYATTVYSMYMLWFKFILGLMVFELVSILFAIIPDDG